MSSTLNSDHPPLVAEATDDINGKGGRKYWTVRMGSEGNYYYRIFRRHLVSATENELTAEERVVDVLAQALKWREEQIEQLKAELNKRIARG